MPMPDTREFDVAIVGGGIAGPAMACALADTGWRVLVIERSAEPLDTARGDHLQPKTCEWLADWGVLEEMWALGAEQRLGARYLLPGGELVLHVPVEQLDIPHPYFLYLNHELISRALLTAAARNAAFELWRPASAQPIENAAGFGLSVERDGRTVHVQARLVVAADGRASRLRRAAGINADTYAYRNPMLTLFARRTVDDPRNEVRAYFSAAGVISVVPRTGGGWKIGLPVPPAELARWKRSSTDELGAHLAELVPELAGVRPTICGVYPITRMNAARWTKRNLVLLGDACNTLHPGRSQGMNVAMRATHRLVQMLIGTNGLASADVLSATLAAYEAEVKPPMDARLADNHSRGLAMDRLDPVETDGLRARLAAVAANDASWRSYCLAAAGY